MSGAGFRRGPVAAVVGAGHGAGRAVALGLATRGSPVLVHDAPGGGGEDVVDEIRRAGGRAELHRADVAAFAGAAALVRRTIELFGRLDVLVNHVADLHHVPVTGTGRQADDAAAFAREFEAHVAPVMGTMRAALGPMRAQGGGRIVNMAAAFPSVLRAGTAACLAAQTAVAGMTNCAASEGAGGGVSANVVYGEPAMDSTPVVELVVLLATAPSTDVTARCLRVDDAGVVTDVAAEAGPLVALHDWRAEELARVFPVTP